MMNRKMLLALAVLVALALILVGIRVLRTRGATRVSVAGAQSASGTAAVTPARVAAAPDAAEDVEPEDVAAKALEAANPDPAATANLEQLLTLVLYKKVSNMDDALRFLGTDPDALVPLLMARLDSPLPLERTMSIWVAMCMFPDGRFLPLAEKAMMDKDEKARIYAMQYFASTGLTSPETERIIRDVLKNDENMKARDVAVLFYMQECVSHPEWIDDDLSNVLSGLLNAAVPEEADTLPMRAAWILAMTSKGDSNTIEALKAAYLKGKDAEGNGRSVAVAAAAALARRTAAGFDVKNFLLANLAGNQDVVVASSIVGLSNFADDPNVRKAVANAVPAKSFDADHSPINRTYEALIEYAKVAGRDEELAAACSRALASPLKDMPETLLRAWMGATLANLGKKEGADTLLGLATQGEPNLNNFRTYALGELRRATGGTLPLRPNMYPPDASGIQQWRAFIDEKYK